MAEYTAVLRAFFLFFYKSHSQSDWTANVPRKKSRVDAISEKMMKMNRHGTARQNNGEKSVV
jgi:hypothetical protein